MKRNLNSTVGIFMLLALAAGCKKEQPPAPPEPPKPQQAAPAAKPVVPVQKQLSSAILGGGRVDFSKKTDPFKPYAAALPAPAAQPGAPAAAPPADLLPIQSFEVSKFKVAGIIAGLQENRALVIDPNGKGYVVRVGMQIGNNNGRITRITASTIEVVEHYRESGRTKSKTIVLALAKKR